MDDDNDDWLSGAADPEPEPVPAAPTKKTKKKGSIAAAGGADAAPAADDAPADAAPEEAPVEAEPEGEYLDPDKLLLFKHWIRPKFLPYKYLTDYRKNYYDDVIDYLDKRSHGVSRDIPVAQTWAERALRTYNKHSNKIETWKIKLEDKKLVEETRPRYLQYKCLYDYRRSYYDDVLSYIESRRKGYRRDIPRPQTWAQRILRTYNDPLYKVETFNRYLEDIKLVTRSEISGRIYSYQSSQNFNKRYTTKINF